jgi:ferrochelatase
MAYGTASGAHDIERYYTDIRGGRPPAPEALDDLKRRYAAVGNAFPLDRITREQAAALERELGPGFRAYVGYKHSAPFIHETVARMANDGIREAVGIAMAPHYSRMSIGGYVERVEKAAADRGPTFTFVESWHLHPRFLDLLTDRVSTARDRLTPEERAEDLVVFTAHSLPTRIREWDDPYPRQLEQTAEVVAVRLGLEPGRVAVAWQSAGRTGEPWLGPSLDETIEKAAVDGRRAVVVCPCGFTADHLEILYDIDIEARAVAEQVGLRLVRTESMNADLTFIAVVAEVVREASMNPREDERP